MRLPVEAPRVSRADCSSATVSAVGEVCPRLLVDMSRGSLTDLSPTIYSLPLLRASDSTRHRILSAQIGSRGHLQNRSPQRRAMWFRSRYVSAFGDEPLINPFVLGAGTAGSCGYLGLGGSWLGARGCGSSDRVFSGRSCQVEFLCNLGYGDRAKLFPRSPRLEFDEACPLLYEHSSLPGAAWTISGSCAAASFGEAVARSQPR